MSWAAVAAVALQVVNGVVGQRVKKAGEELGEAKAKYENADRQNRNRLSQAEANTANVVQSINNRRLLDAAGAQLGRAGEALGRAQEAATANSFSRRVAGAEEAGEGVALAAFAGVTGGSTQTLAETATLRQEAVEELAGRQQEQAEYELRKGAAEQVSAGIAGLSTQVIRPNIDVGHSVNQAPKAGSVLDNVDLGKLAGNLVSIYSGVTGGGSFVDSKSTTNGASNGGDRGTRGGF